MSSVEINKIIAAVLTAGIVAMASNFVAEVLFPHEALEEPAYRIAALGEDEAAPGEETGAGAAESLAVLLAGADSGAGEAVAKKCTACHTFDKGGAHKIGPNLWDIIGRQIASGEGFAYSGALQDLSGETWTYEALDAFLLAPKDFAPGTKMNFAGLTKAEQRAGLIAYLRAQSDSPQSLPSPEEAALEVEPAAAPAVDATAEAAAATAPSGSGSLGAQIAVADAEAGKKVARKCTACHSFDQAGAKKLGPALYNVLGRPVAATDGYKYSSALEAKSDESWTYANLDAFLAKPTDWAPGTKMSFAGVQKPEDRAALMAFLRAMHDDPPPLPD